MNFIIDKYKDIMFFNTVNHPTHYLLFLQSQYIVNKILNNNQSISINNYFDGNNRSYFKKFSYIILPGKEIVNDEISNVTGIKKDADYFE